VLYRHDGISTIVAADGGDARSPVAIFIGRGEWRPGFGGKPGRWGVIFWVACSGSANGELSTHL
jgi:hypothetical protein